MAGGKGATLALKITGDASGAKRALDEVEGKAGSFDGVFKKAGAGIVAGLAGATAALGAFGVAAFNAASDAQQASGAVDAVFGKFAGGIKASAAAAADEVGLAAADYNQLASLIGAQLNGTGMAMDEVTGRTESLIGMGADLAAQFGGSTAEAVDALSSVLKGETDPIERYGVSIKQSDINARLAAQGQDKLTGSALKTATAQAALGLVTEQTKSAQGAFSRESDTAAGATQRLGAMWDNFQASIGQRLLPIVTTFANFLKDTVLPIVSKWTEEGGFLFNLWTKLSDFVTGQLVPSIVGLWNQLAPKLIPVIKDVGRFINGVLIPAFRAVWGFVSQYVIPAFVKYAGPVLGGIRSAFKTVTDAIMRNKDRFTDLWNGAKPVFAFLRDKVAPFIGGALATSFKVLGTIISTVVDAIGAIVDAIKWVIDKGKAVADFFGNLFGGPAPTPNPGAFGAAAPLRGAGIGGGLFGAAGSLSGGGVGFTATRAGSAPAGDTFYITVTGALDPSAVADQIADMLDKRARRTGAKLAGALG